jgi:chorismate synthase
MGGAVAAKVLSHYGVSVCAYTKSIANMQIGNAWVAESYEPVDIAGICRLRDQSPLYMPDTDASMGAEQYLRRLSESGDSAGGVVECIVNGLPAGVGDPVFDKLDARLAYAVMSIGAVKGVEIGSGFGTAGLTGGQNNDTYMQISDYAGGTKHVKRTNHAGGILGGISDGSDIVLRAAIKPTPSIHIEQDTITAEGALTKIAIAGRHDPVIVPRAVVVVESMVALAVLDLLMSAKCARLV